MRLLPFSLALLAAAAAFGQDTLIGPVPFAPPPHPVSPAGVSFVRLAAPQAQAMGLPTVAAGLYRAALAVPGADRQSLELALAAALLDDGRPEEAEAALAAAPDHASASWHLRRGLAELALRRLDSARAEAAACSASQLGPDDQPWYQYLEGSLFAASGNSEAAAQFFQRARDRAPSALARARFVLAQTEEELRRAPPAADVLQQTARQAAALRGEAVGYDYARAYAVMLDVAGQPAAAMAALQGALRLVPKGPGPRRDDLEMLLGVIGGAAGGPGRAALTTLLAEGGDEDRRRVALQLLAQASRSDPARTEYRALLDRLIAQPGMDRSPLMDDLLLYRASEAADEGDSAGAIAYSERLLATFPGSELRPYALAVQTRAAWNQQRYRAAAALAGQARDATGWADGKALFSVVGAEAWFRAGLSGGDPADFRSAAAAYAAVLRRPPAGLHPSELRFQRVESEILAGDAAGAGAVIDEMARHPDFNVVDRWRAELNLAFALQREGAMPAAFERINRVLAEPLGPGVPPELRGRMAWLQADLAYEDGKYETALALAGGLDAATARVPEPLRSSIRAWGPLLQGEALFALGRDAEARAVLARLRAEHRGSDAAIESYLTEADHSAAQGRSAEGERLLLQVAQEFPDSGYADTALFTAAQLAERLGSPADLDRARELIERLVNRYPDSPLYFDARMEEGNLLRNRNRFDLAQQTYESLMNNPRFALAPDRVLAQLALADCNSAVADDPGHAEKAASLYQDILEREDLGRRADGTDIRVEAGCKLGELYRRSRRSADAENVWFAQVMHPFLLDGARGAALGSTGRYWMARTVLDLGELLLADGKRDQARDALGLGERAGLLDDALVRKRLSLSAAPAAD